MSEEKYTLAEIQELLQKKNKKQTKTPKDPAVEVLETPTEPEKPKRKPRKPITERQREVLAAGRAKRLEKLAGRKIKIPDENKPTD
jgi:hypothetical protein